jgi:hypothetical protein
MATLTHKTYEEMRDILRPLDAYDRVTLHHSEGIRFENINGLLTVRIGQGDDTRDIRITEEMWNSIVSDLGAGRRYFAATPVELLYPQLNYWYGSEEASKEPVQALVSTDDGVEYANEILKPGRFPVNSEEVLTVMREVIGPDAGYVGTMQDLRAVTVSAITNDKQTEITGTRHTGDILSGGVNVAWSPVGQIPVSVRTYVERLVCTNGMTMTDHSSTWTQPAGQGAESVSEWLEGALTRAYEHVEAEFGAAQAMADTPIAEDNVPRLVADLFDHYRLPAALQQAVSRRLADQNVETMWDITNAITAAATHDERIADPMQRIRLMSFGGDVMTHSEVCPTCAHLID